MKLHKPVNLTFLDLFLLGMLLGLPSMAAMIAIIWVVMGWG